ncbi:hypothetical protein [Clostridium cochlearium]|uniref:hypothetical protein n=1 Tax=Clostridium cochlearium TaxID=1494 RepID=UPI0015A32B93|nr:hypothetical protein [Clostridium cochlearium]MBU5269081.1 hypothetical protein [Clostridium cochlearium]
MRIENSFLEDRGQLTEDSEAEHQRHFKFSYFTKSLALAKPKERSYKIKNFLEC